MNLRLTPAKASPPTRTASAPRGNTIRHHAVWIALGIVIVLLLLPGPIAERYTSPTQDGQYLINPLRAYSFIIALAGVSGHAALSSSGEALARAKSLYLKHPSHPVLVELLYVVDQDPYVYVQRGGDVLTITSPPRLIWEIWGRDDQATVFPATPTRDPLDVIGFLDYESGQPLPLSETPQWTGALPPE